MPGSQVVRQRPLKPPFVGPNPTRATSKRNLLIMEGKTHYEQIIGGAQEGKDSAREELQAAFNEPDKRLAEYEVEKTPEDIEIIKKTESIVDKMILRYGGKPKPLPLNNVYILRPESVLAVSKDKFAGGIFMSFGLKIGVEKRESKLLMANGIAHELFHLKSYKSIRAGEPGELTHPYRSGLSMIDRKEESDGRDYFAKMEEAVVAECTRRFLDEISKEDLFREDMAALDQLKRWIAAFFRRSGVTEEKIKEFEWELKYIANPSERVKEVLAYSDDENARQAYATGLFDALHKRGETETTERYIERNKLYKLLDKLVASSGGKFKNREEIFDEFAKANFSGNYLPLARIVEGILGKGTFRKIAEEFSRVPKKKESETSETSNS